MGSENSIWGPERVGYCGNPALKKVIKKGGKRQYNDLIFTNARQF